MASKVTGTPTVRDLFTLSYYVTSFNCAQALWHRHIFFELVGQSCTFNGGHLPGKFKAFWQTDGDAHAVVLMVSLSLDPSLLSIHHCDESDDV